MKIFKKLTRRLNFFEKMLLLVGLAVTMIGFYYINKLYTGEGHLTWAVLQAAFLWLLLLFMIILTDSNESIKEELKEMIGQHVEETRLLKKISQEQLAELKIMNAVLSDKGKKRK
ncbi:MAG: hypothetical protein V1729_04120 [Candidatus Woesearchaeota archaeon]